MRSGKRRVLGAAAASILLLVLLLTTPQLALVARSRGRVYDEAECVPAAEYGIVFGAYVAATGELSDAARERVEAATELYRQGVVQKLFVSGDSRSNQQAEAMAGHARLGGVAAADVVVDPLGIDTHDTCRHFAALAQQAVMVTQAYHLPRAMYMCEREGVEGVGLAANRLGLLAERGDGLLAVWGTRLYRFARESILTWAFLLGVYERISDEAEQLEERGG
jgi:SanA protein